MASPSLITNEKDNIVVFQLNASSAHASLTNISIDLSPIGGSTDTKMTNIAGSLYRSIKAYAMDSFGQIATNTIYLTIKSIVVLDNENLTPSLITNNRTNVITASVKALSQWGNVTNVNIDLSPVNGNSRTSMTDISGGTNFRYSYTVMPATSAGDFNLVISAVDENTNYGIKTVSLVIIDKSLPLAPSNITVTINRKQVKLKWDAAFDETGISGYKILKGIQPGIYTNTFILTNANQISWTDTAVESEKTYYYAIISIDTSSNESLLSDEIKVDVPAFAPDFHLQAQADKEKVVLQWNKIKDIIGISKYKIYKKEQKGDYYKTTITRNSSWTDKEIINDKLYYYKITAIDNNGDESLPSKEIKVVIPSLEGLIQVRNNYISLVREESYAEIYLEIMESDSSVKIDIYNINGMLVKNIIDSNYTKGIYHLKWFLDNAFEEKVDTGLYIVIIKINEQLIRRKIMVIK